MENQSAHIPIYPDHSYSTPRYVVPAAPAIVVHALKENKKPIGFAPWPQEKPKRTRKPKATPSP